MEKSVIIGHQGLELEAALDLSSAKRGVVITHPHPLYGGDMDNPVVLAVRDGYLCNGFTTLRFNFRGVGRSQGRYSDGLEEQDDVKAAVAYLSHLGIDEIHLAGYSFGSWVNASIDFSPIVIEQMFMVAPPVAVMDFECIPPITRPLFIITGSMDEIAPPEQIRALMKTWNPEAVLYVIQGADHFSLGAGSWLRKKVAELSCKRS
ncbi:MAG: alpha/beta hydrolase [Pseudomonadota bacterium]